MNHYEVRDKSSPMDFEYTHPLGRLAQYSVQDDDGPARKRPHSDISSQTRPFSPFSPSHQLPRTPAPIRFGTNTPFIFNTPVPLPPTPAFERYDPNKWAGTSFGFGPSSSWKGVEDVEMSNADSPARGVGAGTGVAAQANSQANEVVKENTEGDVKSGPADKEEDVRPIATGAVARVRKRRQKAWGRKNRRGRESESEAEDNDDDRVVSTRSKSGPTKSEHTYNLHMAPPGVRHSEIPHILLGYLQFFFNASLVLVFLYLAIQFILTVRRDVKDRIEEYSIEILQEIAGCTNLYLTNRCDPNLRVPAMETACKAWESCMNRDPTVVGRARVGAETFAGVINSFVDPISWKTMGFTLVTLSFLIILTNSALFTLRAKTNYQPPEPQNGIYQPQPPQPYMHQQPYNYAGQYNGQYPGQLHGGPSGLPGVPGGLDGDIQGKNQIGWGKEKKKGWW